MPNLDKYLNNNDDINLLKRFASTGSRNSFDSKLEYLTRIAEPENWLYSETNDDKISVIFYYIVHTFDRLFKQNKILINENEEIAIFNTGLLSPQGDEIIGLFEKSEYYNVDDKSSNYWHFKRFVKENERSFIELGLPLPEIASYFEEYNELYFDPNKEISVNFNHFYEDNYDRLPTELQSLDIDVARPAFQGFLDFTVKKIKRNSRIPVPQFYRDKIMFLIPVKVFGTKTVVIAVEEVGNQYIANTVLTMGMAYNCARLITKPESNWLLIER